MTASAGILERLLLLAATNAVTVCVLAALVFAATKVIRRPPVAHFLWLLVLLKLVTPPILPIPASRLEDLRQLAATLLEPERIDPPSPVSMSRPALEEDWINSPDPRLFSGDFSPPSAASFTAAVEASSDTTIVAASNGRDLIPGRADAPPPAGTSQDARSRAAAILLIALWLGGAVLILAIAVARILRFDRLLRLARPVPDSIAARTEELARGLGLLRSPEVVTIAARIPPLVWAWRGSPRLVLPALLLENMTTRQLETCIAHELAHLRRRDHWLRWPELLITALFWWHPIAWWARRELRQAEEQCCDAWVQRQFPMDVQDYARALFVTVDFLSSGHLAVPRTASTFGEGKLLKRRLEMILHATLQHRLSTSIMTLLVLAAALILPWAPADAFGQRAEPDDESSETPPAPAARPPQTDPPVVLTAPAPARQALPSPARGRDGDVEARLAKLEDQIATLLAELRSARTPALPGMAGLPAPGVVVSAVPLTPSPRASAPSAPTIALSSGAATATTDGKRVYSVNAPEGEVIATDPESGRVLWTTKVPHSAARVEPRGRKVIIQDPNAAEVAVLDSRTGVVFRGAGESAAAGTTSAETRVAPTPAPAGLRGAPSSGVSAGTVRLESGKMDSATPTEDGRDLKALRDELRAEKERLRARLREIEALEADLRSNPVSKPVR